ncbi:MAG: carboxylating nicotinate-nucleotide diphosphorylase [Planctomycetaceae bacterium]|nr:carboxylating nicotinate-nucleotide diphosphorylase [Planctomycetaceae bacterium]
MAIELDLPTEQLHLVDRLLDLTIDEDIGSGDATTLSLFPDPGSAQGDFTARQSGVMAGGGVVARFYARLGARFADNDAAVTVEALKRDGDLFKKGDKLLRVAGDAAVILMGERGALNLLQRMCAVAGRTRQYADKVAGTRAKVYDTRKTTPGHRVLDKLAVRAGGGANHRMGLFDMILVKDNHLAKYGGPAKAVAAARSRSSLPVMVEVDTLDQLREALPAEPDYILLDNMGPDTLTAAVGITDSVTGEKGLKRPELEASGGITLETVAAAAASGVDRISVGALTHGAGSVDIGLDFV